MTHIRMILKQLCLSAMFGTIHFKITLFQGYFLLPMLCSMLLIYPNFEVNSIIFPNFGQGPFPKIAWKSPAMCNNKTSFDYIYTQHIGLSMYLLSCLVSFEIRSKSLNRNKSHHCL